MGERVCALCDISHTNVPARRIVAIKYGNVRFFGRFRPIHCPESQINHAQPTLPDDELDVFCFSETVAYFNVCE